MAAINYYLGLQRGAGNSTFLVVAGTVSATTSVDVELRLQIDNGTNATGLTKKDVLTLLETLEGYIISTGANGAGTFLPAL